MAFSFSLQNGGFYSFVSKQDFKQFAASWISKPGKGKCHPFFSPLWVTALLVASRIRGVAIQIQVGVFGDRALKFAFLSL